MTTEQLRQPIPTLYWVLFATCAVTALLPFWVVDILPFQDLPGHLATVRVMRDLGTGSIYDGLYIKAPGPLPNTLYFALTSALSSLMPIDVASKVVLSSTALSLPLSCLYLLRTFGRPCWLSLLAFLMVFNYPLGRGFLAFALSMPILVMTVALGHRDAMERSWRTGVALALAIALCFYGHAQIYLLGMLFGGVMVLLSWEGARAMLRRVVPYAVGSVPFGAWFLRYFVIRETKAPVVYDAASDGFGALWLPLRELVTGMRMFVVALFPSSLDEVGVVVIGALLAVVLVLAIARPVPRSGLPGLRHWTVPILATVALAGYFLVPAHMQKQASISFRFLPVAVLLLGMSGSVPRRPALAAALAVTIAAASSAFNTQVARELSAWVTTNVGDIRGLMALTEPGKRLGYLRLDRRSYTTLEFRNAWYLDSYYMVYQRGLAQMNFHYTYPNHVAYAPGQEPTRTPRRSLRGFFRRDLDSFYDYLLIYSPDEPKLGRYAERLRSIGQSGYLRLYAIEPSEGVGPRSSAPSGIRVPMRALGRCRSAPGGCST